MAILLISGRIKSMEKGPMISSDKKPRGYLQRLPKAYYQGNAFVHWNMTIENRKQGWLNPNFHYAFREFLVHTMWRNDLCCPIYCCMPDHFHLLWLGLSIDSDQLLAIRYFRRLVNRTLKPLGMRLQKQPFDHVLREKERNKTAFEEVSGYISRNPERANLRPENESRHYPYIGSVVPGYPILSFWDDDFWDKFWRIYLKLWDKDLPKKT